MFIFFFEQLSGIVLIIKREIRKIGRKRARERILKGS